MGYRMYLGKAPKNTELLIDVDYGHGCRGVERSNNIKNVIELGKYVEWRKGGATNLMGENADTELYIVDKEFLLEIIEEYRKMNHEYHKELADKIACICTRLDKEPSAAFNIDDLSCPWRVTSIFRKEGL